MSYKLSTGLSPEPDVIEIADFWEVECLKKADHTASILDIAKSIGITDDIQETEADEEEQQLEEELQEVVNEIERRIKSCSGKYPFILDSRSNILSINAEVEEKWLWIYTYLLLATRNNMKDNKSVGNIDGTLIFEKLGKDSLTNYLGSKSKGINFGTTVHGGFYEKLGDLVQNINEGKLQAENAEITYNPQDDKLDIVAWIPFDDDLPSKLICFAQCKTGTNWTSTVEQLNVSSFLKKWFSLHPAVDPIRTFIIADILNPKNFYNRSTNNLFIDRCRLTSFSILKEGNDWYNDLQTWTGGIMGQFHLSFN